MTDQQVNIPAVEATIETLWGADMIATFYRVYQTINNAMRKGFEAGVDLGIEQGFNQGVEFTTREFEDNVLDQSADAFSVRLGNEEFYDHTLVRDSGDEQPEYYQTNDELYPALN